MLPRPAITRAGLVLGAGTRLARIGQGRPDLAGDRALALPAVAGGRPVGADALAPVGKAAEDRRRGERALADIRPALAPLPHLARDDASIGAAAAELRLAERLLDHGVPPGALLDALASTVPTFRPADVTKGYANQPRVPAGNGRESGRWTAFWSAVRDWLNVEETVYDEATQEPVGTATRGALLAPYAVVAAGAAAVYGGEALIETAAAPASASAAAISIKEAAELLPAGMKLREFGELAGFAQGLEASARASTKASVEILQRLRAADVSKRAITLFRRAYAQEARTNPENTSAFHRARYLRNIERRY